MREDAKNRLQAMLSRGRGSRRGLLLGTTILAAFSVPALAQTLPTGGQYVAGSGGIATAGSGMTISQSTSRGIIDWQGFSIGSANNVQFDNGSGATLNRVTGGNLSTIAGQLGATGSVYLINPNGVVVGPGGQVLTGGSFVASTRDVPNAQFMSGGTLTFSGTSNGTVTNQGSITSQNGDVVLIGQAASNSGMISAPNGTAALAAGNQVLLSPENGPAGIYVTPDTTATGDASNSGTIKAAAAALAAAGGNVYALAGNTGGLIQATGSQNIAGQVWLSAPNGTVNVTGTVAATNEDGSGGQIVADGQGVALGATSVLSASGTSGGTVLVGIEPGATSEAANTTIASGAHILATGAGTEGGQIETSGQTLSLGSATIDAGAGGSWVIDPVDLTINTAAATSIDRALNSDTSVTEETNGSTASDFGTQSSGPGDINVDAAISWNTNATLTLEAYHSVNVNAAITATGNGTLDITHNYNGGTGGALNFGPVGDIQFTTPNEGALNINGNAYTLIWTLPELQAVGSSGNYALATDLNAFGVTGFTPIAETSAFTGTFNGLGNRVSNLDITSRDHYVGLFGQIGAGGVVENIGLSGGTVVGANAFSFIGDLVGMNEGTISDSYATGPVVTLLGYAGGLVGWNLGAINDSYAEGAVSGGLSGGLTGFNRGTITGSHATGQVSCTNCTGQIGGLVGMNEGTISASYAEGAVSGAGNVGGLVGFNTATGRIIDASYATGAVSSGGGPGTRVGGLVGANDGTISGAYAEGAVTDKANGSYVGGLVGYNDHGTISDSHASGNVTGGASIVFIVITDQAAVGGLVGENAGSGTITNSYATGTVTAGEYAHVGGLVGNNFGTVSNSYATGSVSGQFRAYVGGLVGENKGTIRDSKASGAVTGSVGQVGSLVGANLVSGRIIGSSATGTVNGESGKLVGENRGEIIP